MSNVQVELEADAMMLAVLRLSLIHISLLRARTMPSFRMRPMTESTTKMMNSRRRLIDVYKRQVYVCGLEVEDPTGPVVVEFLERACRDKVIFFTPGPRPDAVPLDLSLIHIW